MFLVGAPLAGFISDRLVTSYRTHRGGKWYPEDRLRGTLIGAGIFVPLSALGSGLLSDPRLAWLFGHGKAGFIGNLICLFFNGMGVDLVLSPSAAYGVDILHERSAESMAANKSVNLLSMVCNSSSFVVAYVRSSFPSLLRALFHLLRLPEWPWQVLLQQQGLGH